MSDYTHPLQQSCIGCGGVLGPANKTGVCSTCSGNASTGEGRWKNRKDTRQCLDCDTMILKSEGKKVCAECRGTGTTDMYRHGDYRMWRDEPDLQSKARRMGLDGQFTSRMLAHVTDFNAIAVGQRLRRAPWAEQADHSSGRVWWRYIGE